MTFLSKPTSVTFLLVKNEKKIIFYIIKDGSLAFIPRTPVTFLSRPTSVTFLLVKKLEKNYFFYNKREKKLFFLLEMIKNEMSWNNNFQILICSGNELRFLEVVENCKNLNFKKIIFSMKNVMIWNENSLEGLKNYKNLRELHCSGNNLKSLKRIENCKDLRELHCSGNNLRSLKGIENCKDLREFGIARVK